MEVFLEDIMKEELDLKAPQLLLKLAKDGYGRWRKVWMDVKQNQLTGPNPPM